MFRKKVEKSHFSTEKADKYKSITKNLGASNCNFIMSKKGGCNFSASYIVVCPTDVFDHAA